MYRKCSLAMWKVSRYAKSALEYVDTLRNIAEDVEMVHQKGRRRQENDKKSLQNG